MRVRVYNGLWIPGMGETARVDLGPLLLARNPRFIPRVIGDWAISASKMRGGCGRVEARASCGELHASFCMSRLVTALRRRAAL